MRYVTCDVRAQKAYLLPIGDVHLGDKAFGKKGREKLKGYLQWVQDTSEARIFLMGDVFNVASRISKTSPWESNSSEYEEASAFFLPVKDRILGAIDGNHEARMLDMFGWSPTQALCASLGVPYCGWSAVIELNVGAIDDRKGFKRNQYFVYCHHTTGGGGSLGGALNRSVKLQDIVQGIDVYCGGHNHQLATGVRTVFMPYPAAHRVVERKITYVDGGSFLDWDESYAEKGMMSVGKLGCPRIRFAGYRHISAKGVAASADGSRDVHVSL